MPQIIKDETTFYKNLGGDHRFVEILPIDLEQKQKCLEASDPVQRLSLVNELLDTVRGPAS